MNRRRMRPVAQRNPELVSVVTGRTALGVAYAHLLSGSTVVHTYQGLTQGHVERRAQRKAAKMFGRQVRYAHRPR